MKNIVIILTCLLLPSFISAQVDDIKRKSEEHKSNKDNQKDDKDSPGSSVADPLASACLTGCAEGCAQIVVPVIIGGIAQHHKYLMDSRDSDPAILSFDIMPHVAYSPTDEYINYLPRIRGTWGVLSTDVRFNYLTEYQGVSSGIYQTIEWQILELNFVAQQVVNFRIGSGLLYENFRGEDEYGDALPKETYNEHFIALEIRIHDRKILTGIEGRGAWDYEVSENVFHEINLRGSYRFINSNNLFAYLTFGVIYQNYYSSVDLLSVQSGLTFNLH